MHLVVVVVWSIHVVQLVRHVLELFLWDHWKPSSPLKLLVNVKKGKLKGVAFQGVVDQEGVVVFAQEVQVEVLKLLATVSNWVLLNAVLSKGIELVYHVVLDLDLVLITKNHGLGFTKSSLYVVEADVSI